MLNYQTWRKRKSKEREPVEHTKPGPVAPGRDPDSPSQPRVWSAPLPRARVRHTSKEIPPSLHRRRYAFGFNSITPTGATLRSEAPLSAAAREEMAERLTRIAIVSEDKCKPKKCRQECKKSCPVVKTGKIPFPAP